VFNTTVVRNLFPGISAGAQRALVDRALRAGEIQRLKAGLYILAAPYRKSELHPFALASLLHFPSQGTRSEILLAAFSTSRQAGLFPRGDPF